MFHGNPLKKIIILYPTFAGFTYIFFAVTLNPWNEAFMKLRESKSVNQCFALTYLKCKIYNLNNFNNEYFKTF